MLLGIDHLVIVVRDLEAAIKDYERLGFTVVPGGRHSVGTHNGLVALADGSYIELIAFYQENQEHRWWASLQKGEGLVDFCMQTDDMLGDAEAFRHAGVRMNDPQPWARIRPDGYELKWVLSIPREGHRGVAPFLIQDETPRAERIPRVTSHENGANGIGTVTVVVQDLDEVRRWYRSLLKSPGVDLNRSDLKARGVRFEAGLHVLEFLAPAGSDSRLTSWLEARGPAPYAGTLTGAAPRGPLDHALTHGANLVFD